MNISENDLPGIGKKFAVETRRGDRMAVVIHTTGDREIYHFEEAEEYPAYTVRLDDAEARQLGAVLGGAFFQPAVAGSMEMAFHELSMEWFKVEREHMFAGRTLREAGIRESTGASVIAIVREGSALPNPAPDVRLQPGDTLLVIGARNQVDRAQKLLLARMDE